MRSRGDARPPGGLTRRLIAASGLLALVVGGGFAVLLLTIQDLRDAARRSDHAQNVLIAANELERLVLDLETGQRGFIATGDERFLRPWNAARAQFPVRASTLLRLVAGDPAAERRAGRIVRAERQYVGAYSEPLVDAARRGDPSARSVAAAVAGMRRIDGMRAEFDALLAAERRTSVVTNASANAAETRAATAAVIGIAGSIALIALYAGFLRRAIVRPVQRAAEMAESVAGGDLGARMPETGPGEVGALARTLNVMARSLERSRDELAGLADEQAALRRVATLVARAAPPAALFAAVAEEVGRVFDAGVTSIGRYDPDGTVTWVAAWMPLRGALAPDDREPPGGRSASTSVFETRMPSRVDSGDDPGPGERGAIARTGRRSGVGVPVTVGRRLWGLVFVGSTGEEPPSPGAEERLADFTELVATAIANTEAQAELTASRARIVSAADDTRRRIERDLHDGAQQRLVSLALRLQGARAAVPPEFGALEAELAEIGAGMTAVLDDLREMARGIHPAILAEGGLGPALRALARRSIVPVELDVRAEGRLPKPVEVGAYYVVSEALTNAAKHARATSVAVEVEVVDDVLRVRVRDDGVGGADFSRGSGLVGLRDRVEALGGWLSVESAPEAGTVLRAELPRDADAGADGASGGAGAAG